MTDRTRQNRIETINRSLGVLSFEVQAGSKAGLTDLNAIAEDIICPILASILNAPDLTSTNTRTHNTDTVDLYSPSTRLGVQITSDTSSSKITSTLKNALNGQWDTKLDRLKFVILSPIAKHRQSKTKKTWMKETPPGLTFDPNEDVIESVSELLKYIKTLDDLSLTSISALLESSIFGSSYQDIKGRAWTMTQAQIQYLIQNKKYIPNLFIETRKPKDLVRCFINPVKFFGWILDHIDRLDLPTYSAHLSSSGISFDYRLSPSLAKHSQNFEEVLNHSKELISYLHTISKLAQDLKNSVYEDSFDISIAPEKRPVFHERRHIIYYSSLRIIIAIDPILEALTSLSRSVTIYTGRAGQGKTMFSCDIVHNTMKANEITCAFMTGHQISQQGDVPFNTALEKLLLGTNHLTSSELLTLLNNHGQEIEKPFIIAIDGLNEHNRISLFADQLHRFISDALAYPYVRFFFTCRSEFFENRFGNLATPPVDMALFKTDSIESSFNDDDQESMVYEHLDYFGIDPNRLSGEVHAAIKRDRILLRIFCECYSPSQIADSFEPILSLYRRDVFYNYLSLRITGAAKSYHESSHKPIDETRRRIVNLLDAIAETMLEHSMYSELPIDQLPDETTDIIDYILGEEILLRRDLSPVTGILPSYAETISFNFDEFRDYLLAERLGRSIFPKSRQRFVDLISRMKDTADAPLEGVSRFLFHISRIEGSQLLYECCNELGIYESAFIPEIFNSRPSDFRPEDVERVKSVLAKYDPKYVYSADTKDDYEGQQRALQAAMILIRRYRVNLYVELNLNLLLGVVESEGVGPYNLVSRCFDHYNGFSLVQTCDALGKISNDDGENKLTKEALLGIVRLLMILLPLGNKINMDTDAYLTLDKLYKTNPSIVLTSLLYGLEKGLPSSRPYVWRLATAHISSTDDLSRLKPLWERDAAITGRIGDEAQRFIMKHINGKTVYD